MGLIISIPLLVWCLLVNSKVRFNMMRKEQQKLVATVVGYDGENSALNEQTDDPGDTIVQLNAKTYNALVVKLVYANRSKKPFKIGDEIEVFWFAGELLYWHAYDRGIYKYLPSRWSIFMKEPIR